LYITTGTWTLDIALLAIIYMLKSKWYMKSTFLCSTGCTVLHIPFIQFRNWYFNIALLSIYILKSKCVLYNNRSMREVIPKIQFYVELVPAFRTWYSLSESWKQRKKQRVWQRLHTNLLFIQKPDCSILTEIQMRNNYDKEMNSPVQKWIHAWTKKQWEQQHIHTNQSSILTLDCSILTSKRKK